MKLTNLLESADTQAKAKQLELRYPSDTVKVEGAKINVYRKNDLFAEYVLKDGRYKRSNMYLVNGGRLGKALTAAYKGSVEHVSSGGHVHAKDGSVIAAWSMTGAPTEGFRLHDPDNGRDYTYVDTLPEVLELLAAFVKKHGGKIDPAVLKAQQKQSKEKHEQAMAALRAAHGIPS